MGISKLFLLSTVPFIWRLVNINQCRAERGFQICFYYPLFLSYGNCLSYSSAGQSGDFKVVAYIKSSDSKCPL